MPYLAKEEDQEQYGQDQPQQIGAGGVSGSVLSPGTTSGGQTPQGTDSGMFTPFSKYAEANKAGSQRMGDRLAETLQNRIGQYGNKVTEYATDYEKDARSRNARAKQAANRAYYHTNPDRVNLQNRYNDQRDDYSDISNPLSTWQNRENETGVEYNQNRYNQLHADDRNLRQDINTMQTNEGRNAALTNMAGRSSTGGGRLLDQYLLQTNPQINNQFQQIQQAYNPNMQGQLDQAQQRIQPLNVATNEALQNLYGRGEELQGIGNDLQSQINTLTGPPPVQNTITEAEQAARQRAIDLAKTQGDFDFNQYQQDALRQMLQGINTGV